MTKTRVARDGDVYEDTRWVGKVWRTSEGWRNDLCSDAWPSRRAALDSLFGILYRAITA